MASLRQQLAELRALQGGRGSCRGAESRCSESLQQMERMHRETLQELHKQHAQQISTLERERDALLREETEATARGNTPMKIILSRLHAHRYRDDVCN